MTSERLAARHAAIAVVLLAAGAVALAGPVQWLLYTVAAALRVPSSRAGISA